MTEISAEISEYAAKARSEISAETSKYVARVGTPFAIAYFTNEKNKRYQKLAATEERLQKIVKIVEEWEDSNAPNSDGPLSLEVDILRTMRRDELYQLIRETEQILDEILRLGPIAGTNPGTQAHLDGNGIPIKLKSMGEIFGDGK